MNNNNKWRKKKILWIEDIPHVHIDDFDVNAIGKQNARITLKKKAPTEWKKNWTK